MLYIYIYTVSTSVYRIIVYEHYIMSYCVTCSFYHIVLSFMIVNHAQTYYISLRYITLMMFHGTE